MGRKVLILSSSFRSNGNSERLAAAFAKGVQGGQTYRGDCLSSREEVRLLQGLYGLPQGRALGD